MGTEIHEHIYIGDLITPFPPTMSVPEIRLMTRPSRLQRPMASTRGDLFGDHLQHGHAWVVLHGKLVVDHLHQEEVLLRGKFPGRRAPPRRALCTPPTSLSRGLRRPRVVVPRPSARRRAAINHH